MTTLHTPSYTVRADAAPPAAAVTAAEINAPSVIFVIALVMARSNLVNARPMSISRGAEVALAGQAFRPRPSSRPGIGARRGPRRDRRSGEWARPHLRSAGRRDS